jgi:hypothetical protein
VMITFKLVNVLYVWCVELDGTAVPACWRTPFHKRQRVRRNPKSKTTPNANPTTTSQATTLPPTPILTSTLLPTATTIRTTRSTVLVHVQDVPCVHIWARWRGACHRHSHGHEQAVLQEGFCNLTHGSSSLHVRKHTHTRLQTHTLALLLGQAYTQTMQNTQVNTLTHTLQTLEHQQQFTVHTSVSPHHMQSSPQPPHKNIIPPAAALAARVIAAARRARRSPAGAEGAPARTAVANEPSNAESAALSAPRSDPPCGLYDTTARAGMPRA